LKKTFVYFVAAFALALMVLIGPGSSIGARAAVAPSPSPYPAMAPIDQYLMSDRNSEIALARTAAPDSISHDATILVFGRHGWETAVTGTNGFVCFVDRSWTTAINYAEYWNPHIRGPQCFNPAAVRTILPITYMITGLVLGGASEAQVISGVKAAYQENKLPAVEPGALSYMMSKDAYLTDAPPHNFGHVMFFVPMSDGTTWGADLPKSPFLTMSFWTPNFTDSLAQGLPAITIVMFGTRHFSDGSKQ
jgi:hypothetical protein